MGDNDFQVGPEEMRNAAQTLSDVHANTGSVISSSAVDAFQHDWQGGMASGATGGLIKAFNTAVENIDGHFVTHVNALIQTSHAYQGADDDAHETVSSFFQGRVVK